MKPAAIIAMFLSLLGIFFALYARSSSGADIQLQWEYPADAQADGFKIFMIGGAVNAYDYAKPVITTGAADRSVVVTVPGIEGKISSYRFVARAFRGDRDSEDSNECETKIDLAPIAKPTGLKCFIEGAQ